MKVTEFIYQSEEYATVFHLVSEIEGDLADEKNFADLLDSDISRWFYYWCTKIPCYGESLTNWNMERRNLYTGSIGYLTLDGACDFNIVIRTAVT